MSPPQTELVGSVLVFDGADSPLSLLEMTARADALHGNSDRLKEVFARKKIRLAVGA